MIWYVIISYVFKHSEVPSSVSADHEMTIGSQIQDCKIRTSVLVVLLPSAYVTPEPDFIDCFLADKFHSQGITCVVSS